MDQGTTSLKGKRILLGAGGSISAYKLPHLVSLLVKAGAEVYPLLSRGAERFVTAVSLETMSKHHVWRDCFDPAPEGFIPHIELAGQADLLLVAPASANQIARLAAGMADDIIGQVALACECPRWIAPAMNVHMLENEATQANLRTLAERGWHVIDSDEGMLACGYVGKGKLPEPEQILQLLSTEAFKNPDTCEMPPSASASKPSAAHAVTSPLAMHLTHDYTGLRVLISAGPTREPIDPVRFISNRSSGKMGYALASAAAARGASVTLVSGPTALERPNGVEFVPVETAAEMQSALEKHFTDSDILIMAAAVADYRPAEPQTQKIKKNQFAAIQLLPTMDILSTLSEKRHTDQTLCGFAMETEQLLERARDKRTRKKLDLICANSIEEPGAGFAVETNHVTLIDEMGEADLPLLSKRDTAEHILDRLLLIRREKQKRANAAVQSEAATSAN